MTPGDSNKNTGVRAPRDVQELDLSSVYGFEQAAAWVRENVLLSRSTAKMLELRVRLPNDGSSGQVSGATIFMDPKDAYVVGFRGRDGIYLLRDDGRNAERCLLDAHLLKNKEKTVTLNIGSDHRSLGTFLPIHGSAGVRPRDFGEADLSRIALLSTFSSTSSTVSLAEVCGAMSLLVCLVAESARARMVEIRFRGLYRNERVSADEAMQSYDRAKRITELANRFFTDVVLAYRVERLEKRAAEISSLLESSRRALNRSTFDRKDFLAKVLQGDTAGYPKELASGVHRLRKMAEELKANAGDLSQMVNLCADKDAVRAAKIGVVIPPIL